MSNSNATKFESFSNDLLFDIFEYLDLYSLFNAFYGLNQRFNSLISSSSVHYELNQTTTDDALWNSIASVVKPIQIRSICITGPYKIDERFINAETINLKNLILRSVTYGTLNEVLTKLPSDLHLVNFSHFGHIAELMLILIFNKYQNKFKQLVNASFNTLNTIENMSQSPFLHLRRLHLETNYLSSAFLQFLRDQTPNLKSLRLICSPDYWSPADFDPTIRVENIRELDIKNDLSFENFSRFLSCFPNLTKLHVLRSINRRLGSPPDGSQWQNLFENSLLKLKHFTLEFPEDGADESIVSSFYHGEFWSNHPVHLRQIIVKWRKLSPKIRSIYFGKEWHFDYFDETRMSR